MSVAELREWYLEDFEAGETCTTMGRTLTEADVMTFVGFAGIFEEIFINAEYAREHTVFKARVVPALCILSVVEGLYVLTGHTHRGRAFLGLDELRLVAPVVCGDTIRAEVTTESVRESASRPGHGVLTLRHRVINQDGVEVMTYKTTRLMERRPG
jgi:3-hydroxybutyryl-CoA dehydratase